MTATATLGVRPCDFRQNYVPDAAFLKGERHWMLDFAAGRDLLKTALVMRQPAGQAGLFSEKGVDKNVLDVKLDAMVDALGLRTMPAPAGPFGEMNAAVRFLAMTVRQVFGL